MIEKIAKYLTENNLKLSLAESCTGGLISSMFTDVAGASNYIEQNFVTYSPSSKIEILGVKSETIKRCGVVSEEVAAEMAQGLIKRWGADFALSTTGMLEEDRGMAFISFASKDALKTIKYISKKHTRAEIKQDIADFAIDFLAQNIP